MTVSRSQVTRDGNSYYVGAGLSQKSYSQNLDQCSFNWKASCAERWAHKIAGDRISQIQQSKDRADLEDRLKEPASLSGSLGFASHVNDGQYVLSDGHYAAAVGLTVSAWAQYTGLGDITTDAKTEGGYVWLGPVARGRVHPDEVEHPVYVLYVPVPLEDYLTKDVVRCLSARCSANAHSER